MKKRKFKFKKIIYKVIPCIVVFCLIFSITAFAYVENEEVKLISTFFDSCDGDFLKVENGDVVGLNYSYFQTKLFSGSGVHLKGHLYMPLYAEEFDPTRYYTFVIPLSFPVGAVNPGYNMLSFITPSGVEISNTSRVVKYPDPNGNYYEREFSTVIYTFNIKGTEISEGCSFFLSVFPSSSSSNRLNFGLLENRTITISSMSQNEYLSLYGGNNQPIAPNGNDTVASYESYEQQLLESGGFNQAVAFYESFDNARIQLPIVAASRLVSELFNYDSDGITIFETIATFSLALGIIVLFLAIAPRLKGASK